jgi:SlyX protein
MGSRDMTGGGHSGSALEAALMDLQMRLTYQDDEIADLSRTVARQQAELDGLRRELEHLRALLAALAPAQGGPPGHEVPPHY